MTNLLIGYSDIGFNSTLLVNPTMATGYTARDVHGGARNRTVRTASATTSSVWEWQHPSAILPDYLFIARADLIRRSDSTDCEWIIEGDDDPFFPAPDVDTNTFGLYDLKGPRSEDLITPLTKISPHPYWRLTLNTTASFKHEHSKVFLGQWLDLQRDPLYPARVKRDSRVAMPRAVPWEFELEWAGITDATLSTFSDKVLKYRDLNPVILYDPNDLIFTGSIRVLHAYIRAVSITPEWAGVNRLQITFEETI